MAATTVQKLAQKHPLQRLSSPSWGASALLHTLGLASFTWSFHWMLTNPNPMNDAFGWHFQHLTIIGLSLATFTFLVGLLADLSTNTFLFSLKNTLSMASAPMEVLISLLYWGLLFIDKRLVQPPWAPALPLAADCSFHLFPALLLLADLLFFSPPYAIGAVPALTLSGAIAVAYWFWVERCAALNGFYPYPIFEALDTYPRMGLFAMSAVTMFVSTMGLKWVYARVNGRAMDSKVKPS